MKKTFQLTIEGKHPDRVLDATKHEIRQYIKRERNKVLPVGADFWDFDCRFGASADEAQVIHPAQLIDHVNALASGGATSFYVVLIAKAGVRSPRPPLEISDDIQE